MKFDSLTLQGTGTAPEQQMRDWVQAPRLPRRQCQVGDAIAALRGHEHVLGEWMAKERDLLDRHHLGELIDGIGVAWRVLEATTDTLPTR